LQRTSRPSRIKAIIGQPAQAGFVAPAEGFSPTATARAEAFGYRYERRLRDRLRNRTR